MATTDINITPGSGVAVAAHSFTEDAETRVVERVAPGTGVLDNPATPQISKQSAAGLYPASAVDIQGKARVGLRWTLSAADVSVGFRILLYDVDDVLFAILPSPTETYTVVASAVETVSEESETRYVGTFFGIANDFGAKSLKIRWPAVPTNSGTVSCFVAGV